MGYNLPRLLFTAPRSGSGKTTATCAVLRALVRRGCRTASFKCGPDYIDPMFHREVVAADASSNLDLFFSGEAAVRALLCKRAGRADIAVIEGAMGYYDGVALSYDASAYALAKATETPAVLVADCRGMAASAAALVKGFAGPRGDAGIRAVLLNRVSPALYPGMKDLIERECGVAVAGYLPPMPDCSLESRHLGLVTGPEVGNLLHKLDLLAEQAERSVDMDLLLRLAASAPQIEARQPVLQPVEGEPVVAVARDAAFCFYYEDTLELLRELGARIVEFSPLADEGLPDGAGALYLGGGYPEVHAARLAENGSMRQAVRTAVRGGMPTLAECGGFLYLHRSLEDEAGRPRPMAGAIEADAYRAGKLSRFGYVTLTARWDNLLCRAGETLPAHEFHYWDSPACGDAFWAQKPLRDRGWDCVHAGGALWAGFPHLYLPARPEAARRFLRAAVRYRKERAQ